MEPWSVQAGYPVVTITRKDNLVTATQRKFKNDPPDGDADDYVDESQR